MIYFRAHVRALEDQIAYLKERLAEAEKESRKLLDRLLAKNNVEPLSQPEKAVAPPPEILTPFGVADAEIQDALKESALREETQYIMGKLGCDESTARGYAEQWYLDQHQVIRGS